MYRRQTTQLQFENFYLPFGGRLRSDNRWVRLAKLIPGAEFEAMYADTLADSGMGCPAKSQRIALGSLIIKERLGSSDEETVAQIQKALLTLCKGVVLGGRKNIGTRYRVFRSFTLFS